MSRWFRLYSDALRNPKVARLSDKEFRLWIELLAVAAENEGVIPCLDGLKHLLRRRLDHLSTGVERLISIGLIDALSDGYEPHNWAKFQYKSDTSTDRVKRHREKRNVSETAPETDTEADTEVAKATHPRGKRAAGERITADWSPSALPSTVAALVADWPPGREQREMEAFRDYWLSRSRDAAKANWDRAWHSRIRDIHDRIMRFNNGKQSSRDNGEPTDPYVQAHLERKAERAAQERGEPGDWSEVG